MLSKEKAKLHKEKRNLLKKAKELQSTYKDSVDTRKKRVDKELTLNGKTVVNNESMKSMALNASKYDKSKLNAVHNKIERINKKLGIKPKLK